MATVLKPAEPQRIDHFFSMPAARADRWRELTALANDWSSGTGSVAAVESALEALGPIEEFHAFPGRRVMSRLRDRLGAGSAEAFAEFARQISRSIVTRQYKQGLIDRQSDDALVDGSDTLVIPYPPGFPIMVPGQVITTETIDFMRKLDVKEIHGYERTKGLKLIKPDVVATVSRR